MREQSNNHGFGLHLTASTERALSIAEDGLCTAAVKDNREVTLTKVGRWMSKQEYDSMLRTEKVIESHTGTTHVALPADVNAFRKQAKPGSMYIEFYVPEAALKQTNVGWAKIVGPRSLEGRFVAKKGGRLLEMPPATNIRIVGMK
ncbi:hypothetical protein BSK59_28915 [Paenibacillus odorifer]|uniref:TreTu family toxin n=1 Tax=Paenibacillus odorifer TaxID=189426 RepID=UPI00096D8D00|nr:hypothetical protein [Paenibacillus odorifer]OME46867.1 hypothetical protein BSK59_28915 [Paenibacillus odorifer]